MLNLHGNNLLKSVTVKHLNPPYQTNPFYAQSWRTQRWLVVCCWSTDLSDGAVSSNVEVLAVRETFYGYMNRLRCVTVTRCSGFIFHLVWHLAPVCAYDAWSLSPGAEVRVCPDDSAESCVNNVPPPTVLRRDVDIKVVHFLLCKESVWLVTAHYFLSLYVTASRLIYSITSCVMRSA